MTSRTLYSYYRSTAAYRLRIALNFKNLDYDVLPVDLINGGQFEKNYQLLNPQMRVPTFIDNEQVLLQSMAILEYLEEAYITPALLPNDPILRAQARAISQIIVADMHPLNNSGTLKYFRDNHDWAKEEINTWYFHWLKKGFDALELIIKPLSDKQYCLANQVTFADLCLIPQIYNAHRFGFSMDNYPILMAINNHCLSLSAFDKARPETQIDYISRENQAIP